MTDRKVSFHVYRGSESGDIVEGIAEREIGPEDAYVRLLHSGVCGTDEHFLHSGCVLGHEGAGVVEDTGASVKELRNGDLVGFGFVHKVCGQCQNCLTGESGPETLGTRSGRLKD